MNKFIRSHYKHTHVYNWVNTEHAESNEQEGDTHPAVNRETAKHLGERKGEKEKHFLIAPVFCVSRGNTVFALCMCPIKIISTSRTSWRRWRRPSIGSLKIPVAFSDCTRRSARIVIRSGINVWFLLQFQWVRVTRRRTQRAFNTFIAIAKETKEKEARMLDVTETHRVCVRLFSYLYLYPSSIPFSSSRSSCSLKPRFFTARMVVSRIILQSLPVLVYACKSSLEIGSFQGKHWASLRK